MANKVSISPYLPLPLNLTSFAAISPFATDLVNALLVELREHAFRLNFASMGDGTEVPSAPVRMNSYVKTALPDAATYPAGLIYVSNDVGGAVPAFSDGTNWRRVTDRAVIA